jgi:hypothetical protein
VADAFDEAQFDIPSQVPRAAAPEGTAAGVAVRGTGFRR